uniref:Uncharacterized protein n=1 Tax=Ananas comosus var. bracteatus TaxID=296719 RepID=A0A6V7QJY3_ANACO|nr:unnamed protein product [Ananas comosus var. bracteatus]
MKRYTSHSMEQGVWQYSSTTIVRWHAEHDGMGINTGGGRSGFFVSDFFSSGFFSSGFGGGPTLITSADLPTFLVRTITSIGSTFPVTRLRMVPEEEILRDKEEIRDLRDRLKFIEEKVTFLLSQQSSASEKSRDGKGASTSEEQGVQATEVAQPRKRRRHQKSYGQTKCRDENHLK